MAPFPPDCALTHDKEGHMIRKTNATRAGLAVLAASLAMAGCNDTPSSASLTPQQQRDLDAVRAVTAGYEDFARATGAGYARITDCMADASGGMGFHYGKAAFIDGTPSLLEPEILMYEPQGNGSLRLVGLEYVVPFTAWTSATPPSLFGLSFHRNEGFGLWVLHVWLYKDNPSGMFTDWNPTVSCAAVS
jgi:hypothetical protein